MRDRMALPVRFGGGGGGKSYRHQIRPGNLRANRTGNLGGGGKLCRHQIGLIWVSSQFGVCTIYPPPNRQVRFTLKSPSMIYPQIAKYDFPPPPPKSSILSKISNTQHHALFHKGLFCERPKSVATGITNYSVISVNETKRHQIYIVVSSLI